MEPRILIDYAERAGMTFSVRAGRLFVTPRELITDQWDAIFRKYHAALVHYLEWCDTPQARIAPLARGLQWHQWMLKQMRAGRCIEPPDYYEEVRGARIPRWNPRPSPLDPTRRPDRCRMCQGSQFVQKGPACWVCVRCHPPAPAQEPARKTRAAATAAA